MRKNSFKTPPFTLDRSRYGDLAEQIAAGLRRAVETGYYAPGDVLPPGRDLATLLGVSKGVAEQALALVRDAGLISPRPRVGSVVLARSDRLWKGSVLFVTRTDGRGYYASVFAAALRARLVKAGWLFTQVTSSTNSAEAPDTSELSVHLGGLVSLAVAMFDNPPAERLLSQSGIPFVTLGDKAECRLAGCVGHVRYDRAAAAGELAAAAKAAGVRSVLQVGTGHHDDLGPALKAAGIASKRWTIDIPPNGKNPEATAFASRDAFADWLKSGRDGARGRAPSLPDLLYFSDDYVCAGALAAFAEAGVKVPGDVRVATWSNAGNNPVFAKELTRMEMDPEGDAKVVADALLARLEGRPAAFPATFGPTFRKGATL